MDPLTRVLYWLMATVIILGVVILALALRYMWREGVIQEMFRRRK